MKKLTSLLISCSLALAGAALAKQPVEQQSPSKGKRAPEKARATQAQQPKPNAAKPETPPAKQHGAIKEHEPTNQPGAMKERGATHERGTTNEPGARKGGKTPANQESANAPGTNVTGQREGAPTPRAKQQVKQQRKGMKVPAVTYNQNYRIQGSDRWQGPQYEVFRSYHPEWHDQGWYRSHYNRVELIGGGYYYWNNGYWYPAWGYSPSAQYYAYDGPIYVGHRAEPPDQVIADVQAELQEMGYYRGEVDGLLGPLTREALTAYQADQGLAT